MKKWKLLKTLSIPLIVSIGGGLTALATVSCSFGNGSSTTTTFGIFTQKNQVDDFVNDYEVIHTDVYDWLDRPIDDPEMCSWFWNKQNCGAFNIVDGYLKYYEQYFDKSENFQIGVKVSITQKNNLVTNTNIFIKFSGTDWYKKDVYVDQTEMLEWGEGDTAPMKYTLEVKSDDGKINSLFNAWSSEYKSLCTVQLGQGVSMFRSEVISTDTHVYLHLLFVASEYPGIKLPPQP